MSRCPRGGGCRYTHMCTEATGQPRAVVPHKPFAVFETRVSRWALGLADSVRFVGQQVPRTHLPPTPQQWDSEYASLRLSFTRGPDSGP